MQEPRSKWRIQRQQVPGKRPAKKVNTRYQFMVCAGFLQILWNILNIAKLIARTVSGVGARVGSRFRQSTTGSAETLPVHLTHRQPLPPGGGCFYII